jgi:hypothetical protein
VNPIAAGNCGPTAVAAHTNVRRDIELRRSAAPDPSPGTPGEGWGEGDFELRMPLILKITPCKTSSSRSWSCCLPPRWNEEQKIDSRGDAVTQSRQSHFDFFRGSASLRKFAPCWSFSHGALSR